MLITNGRDRAGTEEHMLDVARELITRGFDVAAIVAARPDIAWLAEEMREIGVKVEVLAERHGRLGAVARVNALRRALRPYRDGLLHLQFNGHPSGELTMLAARLAGFKRIVRTDHNPPIPNIGMRERLSLRVRDHFLTSIVVISEQDRVLYEALGRDPRKLTVIGHGIHLDRFQDLSKREETRERFGLAPGQALVGNVAHLQESKGSAQFVQMAALVHASNPDTRFLMVGGGPPEVTHYRNLAESLGVGDALIFAGLVPGSEVQSYLAAMDLFVLPSLVESGPYTVLEAMAAGLPIVATEVGFVPQVVLHGITGYVVTVGDPEALAVAVRRVLDDGSGEQMGARGRARVQELHTVSSMVDQIVAVYRSAGLRVPTPLNVEPSR